VAAGVLAGLFGVGGGIVLVPALFEALLASGYDETLAFKLATATSLAIIVPTALSSTRAHHRRGNVDAPIFRRWAPAMAVGVITGVMLVPGLDATPLLALFGSVMLLAALNTLLRPDSSALFAALPGPALQALIAALIGFVCVLMGVGAGTLGVATMTACSVAMHRAVGTAAALGLVIAVPGAALHLLADTPSPAPPLTLGRVSLPAVALMVPVTTLCAPLGVRLSSRLSPRLLQRLFAIFLFLVGLRMLSRLLP
jgi:uncharacterized membrane protein YfcA